MSTKRWSVSFIWVLKRWVRLTRYKNILKGWAIIVGLVCRLKSYWLGRLGLNIIMPNCRWIKK